MNEDDQKSQTDVAPLDGAVHETDVQLLRKEIWRQQTKGSRGQFSDYDIADVSPDMSFLEMLDLLNDRLIRQGERPVEFDHDCREGICGQCTWLCFPRGKSRPANVSKEWLHRWIERDSAIAATRKPVR